jgi:hypothetical protein
MRPLYPLVAVIRFRMGKLTEPARFWLPEIMAKRPPGKAEAAAGAA